MHGAQFIRKINYFNEIQQPTFFFANYERSQNKGTQLPYNYNYHSEIIICGATDRHLATNAARAQSNATRTCAVAVMQCGRMQFA